MSGLFDSFLRSRNRDHVGVFVRAWNRDLRGRLQFKFVQFLALDAKNEAMVFLWDVHRRSRLNRTEDIATYKADEYHSQKTIQRIWISGFPLISFGQVF